MPTIPSFAAMTLTAALLAAPVIAPTAFAQSDTPVTPGNATPATKDVPPAPKTDMPAAAPDKAATAAPADSTTTAAQPSQASVPSLSGTLIVASVKLEPGTSRASKLIGLSVYNEANQKIGTVDDLILKDNDKVVVAVISVGGFLGIGSKLVAVAYDEIHVDKDKAILTGADKEALNRMPSFTYGT